MIHVGKWLTRDGRRATVWQSTVFEDKPGWLGTVSEAGLVAWNQDGTDADARGVSSLDLVEEMPS